MILKNLLRCVGLIIVNALKRYLANKEYLYCDEEDDSIEDLGICIRSLNSLKNRYFKENQYQSKRRANLILNTFVKSTEWIKNKNSTINPQNKDNKCFHYSVVISLYHKEIKNNPERVSKTKPFIDSLNWENINFPPEEQGYKTFEMNNESIALNVLNTEKQQKRSHLYKSEFNKTREKRVILLMTNDNEKQHYLAVKKLGGLFKRKTGHSGECCINC